MWPLPSVQGLARSGTFEFIIMYRPPPLPHVQGIYLYSVWNKGNERAKMLELSLSGEGTVPHIERAVW